MLANVAISDSAMSQSRWSYYRALNGDRTVPEGIFNLYTTKVADMAIIDAQSTAVDACSGCTLSSNAIMKAVQNALEQAE